MNNFTKELTNQELTHFIEFLLKQISLTNSHCIIPLYRGDNLQNLHNKLGVEYFEESPNYSELLKRLFMVGEKSKHFYSSKFFNFSNRNEILIDDINKDVFIYIFDNINSSIKNKNKNIQSFFEKNLSFKNFFLDKKGNKKQFTDSALSAPPQDQLFLRNYYLKLLHQLGAINYKNKSHLVSASSDCSVAERFSSNVGKRIVLHCWAPSYRKIENFIRLGFPVYKSVPYIKQKEFSVLAGILPHFIIGLRIVNDNKFFINPNIFSNGISDSLFRNGLNINQEEFEDVRKQTNYCRSFENRVNEIWR